MYLPFSDLSPFEQRIIRFYISDFWNGRLPSKPFDMIWRSLDEASLYLRVLYVHTYREHYTESIIQIVLYRKCYVKSIIQRVSYGEYCTKSIKQRALYKDYYTKSNIKSYTKSGWGESGRKTDPATGAPASHNFFCQPN